MKLIKGSGVDLTKFKFKKNNSKMSYCQLE